MQKLSKGEPTVSMKKLLPRSLPLKSIPANIANRRCCKNANKINEYQHLRLCFKHFRQRNTTPRRSRSGADEVLTLQGAKGF